MVHRVVSTVAGSGGLLGPVTASGSASSRRLKLGGVAVQLAIWAACAADSAPYRRPVREIGTQAAQLATAATADLQEPTTATGAFVTSA